MGELAAAGYPMLQWSLPSTLDLGAEFVRWELATAVAGEVLDVNPFDEPNVAEAKQATRDLLGRRSSDGGLPAPEPAAMRDDCAAATPPATREILQAAVADP